MRWFLRIITALAVMTVGLSVGYAKVDAPLRELTPKEKYKIYLSELIIENNLTQIDFHILYEIIQCESSWRHYDPNGVIKNKGNVGLGQINLLTWYDFFKRNGLDIYKWEDNLKAVIWLYKEQGIKPWKQWSGHCFLPKIMRYL